MNRNRNIFQEGLMQKINRIITGCCFFIFIITSIIWAQQNNQTGISNIRSLISSANSDSTWNNTTWARVQELANKNRVFAESASDQIVDTGTRAKEFEEGEAQSFYRKNSKKSTENDQIKTAIKLLEDNVAEELYLLEKCYSKIGDTKKGAEIFNVLTTRYPDTIWTKLLLKEQDNK